MQAAGVDSGFAKAVEERDVMVTLTPLEVGLALLALVLVVAVAVMAIAHRRRADLRARFGPEYGRTVEMTGSARKAEAELQQREKRVAAFPIRPLSPQQADAFTDAWVRVQAQFVDDPQGAVSRADVLLAEVMEVRGYPVVDFEQRSADLSVDHPEVVQNYHAAHDIALRHARGDADTEDLRRAMIHYRALFDDLVHEPVDHRMAPSVSRLRQDDVRGPDPR
ncbi:hypothetical protein GCM10019071_04710 [Sphingobium fuliginis]|uniref:Secreted protein n=2 Tax=Sphingomonadaceae TaxID=41297 RepID=A0ABQ1EN62_SPHSA|nr:hypothetical protein GCM10019071_04710 [Sphingobium fuliginis]